MSKVPKSRFPAGATYDYFNAIRNLLIKTHAKTLEVFGGKIAYNIKQDSIRADNEIVKISMFLDTLREETLEYFFNAKNIEDIVGKFTKSASGNISEQFGRQFRAVLGVDPIGRNTKMLDIITAANKENISYIQSIPEVYHNNVETVILQGVRRGKSTKEITNELQHVYEVARNKAKFIARDQAGSLVADINKAKYEQAGLKTFIWSIADDNARDKHRDEFNGKIYTWKEGAGEEGLLPGEDYGCRCTAEINPDELLNV